MAKNYKKHLLILITCCGLMASSVGLCVNAYGVFYTPLSEAFGVGRAAVTLHATLSGLLTGLGAPFVMQILKKISLRKVVIFGAVLSSLSFVMMAFADKIWILNMCGIIRGIGNCCFYMPVITQVIGNWFKSKQDTMVGLVMAFSGIAGAILSPVLTALINSLGYRAAALFGAGFILVLSVPNSLLFLSLSPKEQGVKAYEEASGQARKTQRKVNAFTLKSPVFWYLGGMTFLSVFITGFTSHISGYAESIGMGSVVGATMISAIMIGNIVSKFSSGMISDKIGPTKAFSGMYVLAICGTGLLLVGNTQMSLIAASLLFGSSYACSAVGVPCIVRQIYGDSQYGNAYAIISVISTIAPSIAMMVIGVLYDMTQSYKIVIYICILFGAMALLFWNMASRAAQKRNTISDI